MAAESALIRTAVGELRCHQAVGRRVHRVGFAPEPWAWTPWEYADDGRFSGRWDDPDGFWRTVYAAESRLACYLEVLAFAGADPQLQDALGHIEEDPQDALGHPTQPAGALPGWLYDQTSPDGMALAAVEFASRHGDGLILWAVFERPTDDVVSSLLLEPQAAPITAADPDLVEAMRVHRLEWWPRDTG